MRSTPPAPEVLPPNPPGLIISRALGRGGMGAVYLARDVETGREVAVKLLHAAGDYGAVGRLQVEVDALASLAHPNVVTIFAAKLQQHPPHYTMEFAPAGTLAQFVGDRGPLAPDDGAQLIRAVAHGTHAANQAGVVHRDIKPGNVLLQLKKRTKGSAEPVDLAALRLADVVPKLSDFGLAKQLDRTISLTQGTGILGTPGFMAPEQVTAARVGAPTDVYGLGATLYHVLTGRAPFEEPDARKLVAQIEHAEPARVRVARPEVPVELEAIVHKCLEKKPGARYATAEELADDLDRFLKKEPVLAKPLTPARRARRAVARNRVALARAVAVTCVLVGAFVLGTSTRGDSKSRGVFPSQTEPDWEKIEKDLAAKRPVSLVEAGGPVCPKWAFGTAEIAPGKAGAPCSIQSLDLAMLDLCRDPMTDRYRIRAELSQADVTRTPDGRAPQDGAHEIGVYFGRQTAPGANGLQAQIAFLIKFGELPYAPARLVRAFVPRSPTTSPGIGFEGLAAVPFEPAKQVPGAWRTIEIDVAPAGVEARWIRPDGTASAFRVVPLTELQTKYTMPHDGLNKLVPDNGVAYPMWDARAPIGIWAHRSVVAVRNVTLAPSP